MDSLLICHEKCNYPCITLSSNLDTFSKRPAGASFFPQENSAHGSIFFPSHHRISVGATWVFSWWWITPCMWCLWRSLTLYLGISSKLLEGVVLTDQFKVSDLLISWLLFLYDAVVSLDWIPRSKCCFLHIGCARSTWWHCLCYWPTYSLQGFGKLCVLWWFQTYSEVAFLVSFCTWGKWGPVWLNNLPRVRQPGLCNVSLIFTSPPHDPKSENVWCTYSMQALF